MCDLSILLRTLEIVWKAGTMQTVAPGARILVSIT